MGTPHEVWTLAMSIVRDSLSAAEGAEAKSVLRGLHNIFEASRLISSMQEDITELTPEGSEEDPEFEEDSE